MSSISNAPKLLSDSIQLTLDQVKEVVRSLPPDARARAKAVAVQFERTFEMARRESPRDPAVAIGAAFAVFTIAERLIQLEQNSNEHGSLIQLLN